MLRPARARTGCRLLEWRPQHGDRAEDSARDAASREDRGLAAAQEEGVGESPGELHRAQPDDAERDKPGAG